MKKYIAKRKCFFNDQLYVVGQELTVEDGSTPPHHFKLVEEKKGKAKPKKAEGKKLGKGKGKKAGEPSKAVTERLEALTKKAHANDTVVKGNDTEGVDF